MNIYEEIMSRQGEAGVSLDHADPAGLRRVLGRELREARQRGRYTQAALARDIGYSATTVSNAEAGRPEVSRAFWESADGKLDTGGALTLAHDQITLSQIAKPADTPRGKPESDPDLMTALRNGELQFLTAAEMAGLTRLSKMSIYRLIHDGELDSRRFGRIIRIPVESARQYLAKGST